MRTNVSVGAVSLTVAAAIFVISGYLINIILGKTLGPTGYGVYGIIISLISVINLIQTSGLPWAVARFISADEEKTESILKSGLVVQVISTVFISIIFFLFANVISTLLKDESLSVYLRISTLVFPFYGIYSIYLNYYNGLHYFKKQAVMQIIYSLAKMTIVVLLVYFFHIYGVIFGFIVSPIIALIFFFHIPRAIGHFPYKKLIYFSLPLIGLAVFSNLIQSVDLFFVKALLGSNKLTGFYTANQNVAEIPYYGVIALGSVLFPSISRIVSQNLLKEAKELIQKSLRFSTLLLIPSVFIISATSREVLTFLYSSQYQPGSQALSILSFGGLFFTLFVILCTIISGAGKPSISFYLSAAGLFITSILCFWLIPIFGINGASIATTITAFIIMIAAAYFVYKKFRVLFNVKSLIKIFLASIAVYIIAKVIILPTLLLPVYYVFLFALYIFLLFIFQEFTRDDIILIKSIFPQSLKKVFNL